MKRFGNLMAKFSIFPFQKRLWRNNPSDMLKLTIYFSANYAVSAMVKEWVASELRESNHGDNVVPMTDYADIPEKFEKDFAETDEELDALLAEEHPSSPLWRQQNPLP